MRSRIRQHVQVHQFDVVGHQVRQRAELVDAAEVEHDRQPQVGHAVALGPGQLTGAEQHSGAHPATVRGRLTSARHGG